MASDVDICKLALSHIGDAARINSIDPPDNTIQAAHCATFYPIARDEALEGYDWPFATRRVVLAESLVGVPENEEWGYAYTLPTGYIRAIKLIPPGAAEDHPGENFKVEENETEEDQVILSNVAEAQLIYVFRQEETGRYSPTFISALSLLLGSYLAGAIVKGKVGAELKIRLRREYEGVVRQAAARQLNAAQDDKSYADHQPIWISDR